MRRLMLGGVAVALASALMIPTASAGIAAPEHPRIHAETAKAQRGPLAVWPETDRSQVRSSLPGWRRSAKGTVAQFARHVLHYADPLVVAGHPSFTPQAGDRYFDVARTDGAHRILVATKRVVDASHWSVTYIWGFGNHDHSATVDITKHHAYVGFGYWGRASSAELILTYGDNSVRRIAHHHAVWSFHLSISHDVAGAVIVLFRNASGEVYSGWATALPPGLFSAG